jgi:MYXO-CTERM domain-containing protein
VLARGGQTCLVLLALAGCGAGTAPPSQSGSGTPSPVQNQATPGISREAWAAGVRNAVAAGEYRIRAEGQTLDATNRLQRLRASWSRGELQVSPRTGPSSVGKISIRTVGLGRRGSLKALGSGPYRMGGCASEATKDENGQCLKRVERDLGGVVERWENRPDGLAHSFVIAEPPSEKPRARKDWLAIDVRVSGARTVIAAGSDRAELVGKDGQRLHYAGLAAWDADRKTLPVRMSRITSGVRLEIDDTGARYPVLVDPVLTTASWTVESNEADGGVTMSVNGAGDVNNDGFDDVLVAFPRYDGGGVDAGIVYLFLGAATGPDTTPDWSSQGADAAATPVAAATAGSRFGTSVASAGDVNNDGFADVIIGQTRWSNVEMFEGRAYIFHGSAAGLPANPNWVVESNQASASLGAVVASAGDVDGPQGGARFADVLVSSLLFDSNGLTNNGRVFLYLGGAGGVSTTPADTVDGVATSSFLGSPMAAAGDINGDDRSDVILGSASHTNGEMNEGAAFVFLGRADGTLERTGAFTFETNEAGAQVVSVAGLGDVNGDGFADVAIGSPAKDNGEVDEGVVFFFAGSAAGLTGPTLIDTVVSTTSFGIAVAGPGDVNGDGYADIAIGASRWSNGGAGGVGAVFLIPGSAGGPAITNATLADTILLGASAGDNLGFVVGGAGDVNGDGYADVIAAAPGVINPQSAEGRASLYLGSAETTGLRAVSDRGIESNTAGAGLGTVTAAAGDVNGDGFADYAVAAPNFGGANNGTVFLYHGGAAGADGTPDGTLTGPAGAGFGKAVAAAGDINGDGFGDLVVGAPNFGDGQAEEGRIFVYLGSAGGITAGTAPVTFDSDSAGALLGSAVGGADTNGDGLFDVVAGAPGLGNGQAAEGRVYLFRGSFAGFIATSPVIVESDVADARLGAAVAGAGDFNNDGFGDVVAGAPGYSDGEIGEGRIYLYPGSAAGLGAPITRESDQANAALGTSVDSAGDADGNGFADIVAGAPGAGGGAGVVFVYDSDAAGLTATPFSFASGVAGANLGASVAGGGDLDADGVGDIVAGAPGFANGQANEGAVFVFLSTGTILAAPPALIIEGGTAELRLGTSVAGVRDVNGDGVSDVVAGAPGFSNGEAGEGRALLHLGNTNGRPYRLRAQRPGVATPVHPGSVVPGSMAAFDIALLASGPLGITNVRLETEVKPVGTPFDGAGTVVDPAFTSSGLAGVTLTRNVTGLTGRGRFHYRARIQYDPAQRRLRGRTSPWFYGGILGDAGGTHLRTDGVALGAACTTATECGSGFCVDGVCCATACGGGVTTDCQACSTAAGATMGNGLCTARTVGLTCSDGNGCTTTDTCQANAVCQSGAAVVCMAMSQCHDVGVCDPGTGMCSNPPKMNGTTCSDGSMCTTGETCQAGACTAGTATVCAPMSTCHDPGVCDPATGVCTNPPKPNGAACNDNNLCTQSDTCQGAACVGGNPVVCPTPDQCHDTGVCAPATGMCSNPAKADGTGCNDGDMCTTMDRCMAGACVMGGTMVGCTPIDAGADAATDAPTTDAAGDRPDALTDARDAARDVSDSRPVDVASTDARDAASDARDAASDRPSGSLDARDASSGGADAAIKRVGGGGGCDCDVGQRGRAANVQAPLVLIGLGLLWARRRSRKR